MFSYLKSLKEKHYIFCLYYMGYQLNSSRIQYFLSSQIFFYDLIFKVTTMSEIKFCTGLINNLEQEWSDTAAAAKSLQSCPTLCDPIDGSPPGSPVPGILQARNVMCLITQSCPTLCNLMDCSPPGFSVHGDSLGRNTGVSRHALLRGTSQPRDRTQVSHNAGRRFTIWDTMETHISSYFATILNYLRKSVSQ